MANSADNYIHFFIRVAETYLAVIYPPSPQNLFLALIASLEGQWLFLSVPLGLLREYVGIFWNIVESGTI